MEPSETTGGVLSTRAPGAGVESRKAACPSAAGAGTTSSAAATMPAEAKRLVVRPGFHISQKASRRKVVRAESPGGSCTLWESQMRPG